MQKRRKISKELLSKARAIPPFKEVQPRIAQVHRWEDGKWHRDEKLELLPVLGRERFAGSGKSIKPEGEKLPEKGSIGDVEVRKIKDGLFYLTGKSGFSVLKAGETRLLLVQLGKGNFEGLLGKYGKRNVVGGQEVHEFTPMKESEALATLRRLQEGDKLPPRLFLKYFFHK